MRKTVIALAAVAVLTAGSTITALAHGSGHGGGGGHGGGYGGHMGGGYGHASFAHSAGFARAHSFHFHGDRVAFRHHRFFRHAFFGVGYYPYAAYDDGCRVWTPRGWRWVCY